MVGVSAFSASAPENFATFDLAFTTLFYVTGGDPWPDSLPKARGREREKAWTFWCACVRLVWQRKGQEGSL